jgi:serine/threonine-protein kinase
MQCPQCGSEVEAAAESCFNCGHVLRAPQVTLKRGSIVAARYEILAPLGKGGMGMVYKASDHKLEETVAIKVLRPEIAADPDMERRFRSEIRLARRVRHRNVCGIHEYGEDGSLRYIAMEFIEGVDLRKVLSEEGALPLEQAFEYSIRTAEGLQAIHEAGIIHRDLKTANLMVDARGVLRLMDFGIAKQHGSDATGSTATGLIVGTPEYMSPEQARGEKVDFRSDIYALGVVAFEIFTGRVPFRGETPIATIFKHLQEPPPLEGPEAAALPQPVVPVLRKALAKDAVARYSTAAELAAAFAEARDVAGVAPLAPGPVTPRPSPTVALDSFADGPTLLPEATSSPSKAPTRASLADPPTRALPPSEPTPTARELASRSGRSVPALGSAAIVALALVGGVWLWSQREGTPPSPQPSASPSSTVVEPTPAPLPAVVAGSGTLIVDALPWGEVLEIADAKGAAQALPENRFTPLALSLPAGEYRLRVRPPKGEPRSVSVTVRASAAETEVVDFGRVDAASYLRKSGL